MEASYINEYEAFELKHWWYVVRRRVIHNALDRYALAEGRWLDAGCGSGVLLASYDRITGERKVGLEIDASSVQRARDKGLDVRPAGESWDFSELGVFDLVTACDVLEHVKEDRLAVRAVYEALRPGGIFLATVPALMSLWSDHDVVNHHYRRYDHRTLEALFGPQQWDLLRMTYFSTLLFPMVWGVRKVNNLRKKLRGREDPPRHDVRFGAPWSDRMLQSIFSLERPWLDRGGRFPIGSSLLIVARKRPVESAPQREPA
jgi:SAM-dependent methyltransferase